MGARFDAIACENQRITRWFFCFRISKNTAQSADFERWFTFCGLSNARRSRRHAGPNRPAMIALLICEMLLHRLQKNNPSLSTGIIYLAHGYRKRNKFKPNKIPRQSAFAPGKPAPDFHNTQGKLFCQVLRAKILRGCQGCCRRQHLS